MKYRIGFRINWLEMIMILISTFFAGMIISSHMENKFIYTGLLIFGAGNMLVNKRIKIPIKNKKPE